MTIVTFVYGLVSYGAFFATFLYAIGFLGGFGVPLTVDGGGPESAPGVALGINLALLALFGIQHSVMARPAFKQAWTKVIPKSMERSTYVLLSSLILALTFWLWRPMPGTVWDAQAGPVRAALWTLFALGWVVLLISTFLINHFELFGLQQVWQNLRGQRTTEARFREPLFYKLVRHPLYVGWLMTFWATPTMTVGHLVFAAGASAYILIAIRFEERDLIRAHPEYAEYRRRVPMLIPGFPRTAPQAIAANRHGVASAPVERIGASQ
jgi:protein-S-isoprenylcysteine O-methyltransferase Ste14